MLLWPRRPNANVIGYLTRMHFTPCDQHCKIKPKASTTGSLTLRHPCGPCKLASVAQLHYSTNKVLTRMLYPRGGCFVYCHSQESTRVLASHGHSFKGKRSYRLASSFTSSSWSLKVSKLLSGILMGYHLLNLAYHIPEFRLCEF